MHRLPQQVRRDVALPTSLFSQEASMCDKIFSA